MAISSETRATGRALGLPAHAVVAGYATATAAALALQGLAAPVAGTAGCAVLVAALLAHHALGDDSRLDALAALALVPLGAILAVAMPISEVPRVLWPALVGAPLLLGIALAARRLGLPRAALGLTVAAWRHEACIAATGLPLGVLVYFVLRPDRVEPGFGSAAVAALSIALLAGAGEELLLRGLLQPLLVRAAGAAGLAWTAGVSAALYAGTRSAAAVALAGALSLAAGRAARRTGSIAGVALAHGLLLAGALVVWPAVLTASPHTVPVARHRSVPPSVRASARATAPAPRHEQRPPARPLHRVRPSPVPLWRAFPLSRAGPVERRLSVRGTPAPASRPGRACPPRSPQCAHRAPAR